MVCYMLCGADRLWLPGRTVGFVGAFAIGGRLGEAFLVRISDSSMSAVTQTDPLSTSGKTGRQSLCFVHADWILNKESGDGTDSAADLSGFAFGKRVYRFVPVGQTLRA